MSVTYLLPGFLLLLRLRVDTHKMVDAWDVAAVAEESQKRLMSGFGPEKEVDPKMGAVALAHADAQNWFYKDPQVSIDVIVADVVVDLVTVVAVFVAVPRAHVLA